MRLIRKVLIFTAVLTAVTTTAIPQELPKPTYANSFIVSIEHWVWDPTEIDYIKDKFPFGLYAWLCFSHAFLWNNLDMDWHIGPNNAGNGIQAFKDYVDALIAAAKTKNVGIHIVLVSGLARQPWYYREAKEEDIRAVLEKAARPFYFMDTDLWK